MSPAEMLQERPEAADQASVNGAPPPGPTPGETLYGGLEVDVETLAGARERVLIQQLPVREYPALLAAQDDEEAMAVLYAGRRLAWVRELTPASFERVVVEGERVNADFFSRWMQRRAARMERLLPGATEKLMQRAEAAAVKALQPSLPTPVSRPA